MTRVPDIEHIVYIHASPERVYKILTTGAGWDAWFTQGTTVDPGPGGQIRLRWQNFGAGHWTMEDGGPVLEAVPNRKFVFQWSPASTPTTVTITLEQQGPGTLVRLVESGYKLTDSDLAALVNCATGWGEALTLLKFYLEHGLTYGEVPLREAF
jgi:uncharacterized protein YndB with AHSA1/START domain